ncbi:MAG TPA: hypothetical protein VLQ78_03015 [Ornithinibacter sp.]|nr:hypothetical protein [Ornithinibacter sp.]
MSAALHPPVEATAPTQDPALWRAAGGLALAHVVLLAVGVSVRGTPVTHPGQEGIEHSWSDAPLERILGAGWVDVMGFVVLVPVLVFLARAFGRGESSSWASRSAAAAGLAYVVTVGGAGFSAGAAAAWGAAHGLDLESALAVNNVRNFSYFVGLTFLGAHAVGLGLAALGDRRMVRWVGWGGVGVGVVLILGVPLAAIGVANVAMPLWMLWWVGLAVLMLRHGAGRP